ncbi:hypothetical protein [Sphingomonas bisphenolicum]|uniref:hypothetical protein n=1 Tax=Sphingomonas bisphenolicum TaxID=296544 RepID=UPI0021C490BA|nr:hypothetical protein [Sphingomonas bisphenolicum]
MAIDTRLGRLERLVGFWDKTVTLLDHVRGDQTSQVVDTYTGRQMANSSITTSTAPLANGICNPSK